MFNSHFGNLLHIFRTSGCHFKASETKKFWKNKDLHWILFPIFLPKFIKFVPKFTLFSINFFRQVQGCCNFFQSIDKCLIHILRTYCIFLGPLGAILRLQKQKSFEKTKIFTEFGWLLMFLTQAGKLKTSKRLYYFFFQNFLFPKP